MNSPPYHYYNHYHHDPTIIHVHTLLKPQSPFYKQPTHTSTTLNHQNSFLNFPHQHLPATSQYTVSHTPISHQQQTHTPISTAEIGSLLNQILHSQQHFKHTLSLFANEVSLFANEISNHKTTLTPSSPHNTQHTTLRSEPDPSPFCFTNNNIHTIPKQTYATQKPFYQPQPLQISTSMCHTSLSPNISTHTHTHTHDNTKPSHNLSTHQQPTNILNSLNHPHPTPISPPEVPPSTPTSNLKTVVVVESVRENVFPTSETDEKYAAKRFTLDSLGCLCSSFKNFLFTTATSSPEKQDAHAVAIAVTPQIQTHLCLKLHIVPVQIFDPGGAKLRVHSPAVILRNFCLTFTPASPALVPWDRGKVRVSESLFFVLVKGVLTECLFLFTPPAISPFSARGSGLGAASGWPWVPWSRKYKVPRGCFDVFDPGGACLVFGSNFLQYRLFSCVCAFPWDRGKKNNFLHFRRRCRNFSASFVNNQSCNFAKLWLRQFGSAKIRFGSKENIWVGSFAGIASPTGLYEGYCKD